MNKHLLNAARYLESVHEVTIDESHRKLEAVVRKHMLQMESETLRNYWKAYIKDIDKKIESTIEVEYQGDEVQETNVYQYDGVEKISKKKAKDKPLVYRGVFS